MKKKLLNIIFILLMNIIFIDIISAESYNNYTPLDPKSCGNGLLTGIPPLLPQVVSVIYNIIQVAVPVVLVIMGSIDLIKGITAGKEDEMKKGQQMLIKRLIAAVLIFIIFVVVKLVISLVADDSSDSKKAAKIMQCAECIIKNDC